MIQENIRAIRTEIGDAGLVVVSKYRSLDEMMEVYNSGERIFAENRVQELIRKRQELPSDVEWHLVGHLQTNKVKQVLPIVSLIHSVDTVKLLNTIDKEATKLNIQTKVLLQVHVAEEETKHGFEPNVLLSLAKSMAFANYQSIEFFGLMTMSTLSATSEQVRSEFNQTRELMSAIKPHMPKPDIFTELSMGMSGDYGIALEEGSTLVRIGSAIFS